MMILTTSIPPRMRFDKFPRKENNNKSHLYNEDYYPFKTPPRRSERIKKRKKVSYSLHDTITISEFSDTEPTLAKNPPNVRALLRESNRTQSKPTSSSDSEPEQGPSGGGPG